MAIGDALTEKIGPLPGWAWGLGTVVLVGGYMAYNKRKKVQQQADQAAAQQTVNPSNSSNTVPVSNLTTQAQPMPIQLGDTFVNTPGTPQTVAPAPSPKVGPPDPSAGVLNPASMPPAPPGPVPPPPSSGGVTTSG